MQRSLARWLVVGALAVFGLGFSASAVFAAEHETEVQGQNSSQGGISGTGTAEGSNNSSFNTGPSANAQDNASSQQSGSNSSEVNQEGSAKSGDPVAGGQVTGAVGGSPTVQNQNNATGNLAVSGGANVSNTATDSQGPVANSDDGVAQASQLGRNESRVSQTASAETGDAVSGAQVTGIAGATGPALVQNQNSAFLSLAISGTATATNDADSALGPQAFTSGPPAMSSQVGGNTAILSQGSFAESGDAVANSQVTGAVGSSDLTVQNQNDSRLGFSFSGNAVATSAAVVTAGPVALSIDPNGGQSRAQAGQAGSNLVRADQVSGSATGDALAGAQVTGLVSSETGQLQVQNQQSSEADFAFSGSATSDALLLSSAGPVAIADAAAQNGDGTNSANAQASQLGNNATHAAQATDAQTGDAVAGGQVTGTVGGSEVTVQNQNSASFTLAVAGTANSTSQAVVLGGPQAIADASSIGSVGGDARAASTQSGNNLATVDQTVSSASGDAVSGGQVTGVVAGTADITVQNQNSAQFTFAVSGSANAAALANVANGPGAIATASAIGQQDAEGGTARANASQLGSNAGHVAQATSVDTGDAVSGSQVNGIVSGNNSNVVVSGQNSADVAVAVSGFGTTATIANVFGGPIAGASAGATANDTASGGDARANASQIGGNNAEIAQSSDIATGDALAGSQVNGVVTGSGSSVEIQAQNSSNVTFALSGFGLNVSVATAVVGPTSSATAGASGNVATGGTANSGTVQSGNNRGVISQASDIATGDAVSGGQISGVVAGSNSDVTVQGQNSANVALSVSGFGVAIPVALVSAGPSSEASASAVGNLLAVAGDATAQTSQSGNNVGVVSQSTNVDTGDAVSGGQIAGLVAGAGSNLTVQNQNDAFATLAISGFGIALPIADVGTGPIAGANADAIATGGNVSVAVAGDAQATAGQLGDNSGRIAQSTTVDTGDAVGGSQITGAVAGAGSNLTVQNQNSNLLGFGFSGFALAAPTANVTGGPAAIATADAFATANVVALGGGGDARSASTQAGSNFADIAQATTANTGDAVVGAQVTGLVAGPGSRATVSGQNTSALSLAVSAPAFATNAATVALGPAAVSSAGALANAAVAVAFDGDTRANASQLGRNVALADQFATALSGDAVVGSQVVGSVGAPTRVQFQNDSSLQASFASPVTATNDVGGALGPVASSPQGPASVQQTGGSSARAGQGFVSETGDALTGAQISGVVS